MSEEFEDQPEPTTPEYHLEQMRHLTALIAMHTAAGNADLAKCGEWNCDYAEMAWKCSMLHEAHARRYTELHESP